MENKKRTALQELIAWGDEMLLKHPQKTLSFGEAIDKAVELLEKEKEQITKACYDGYYQEGFYDVRKYYDETYMTEDLSDWDVTLMDGLEDEPPYISDDFQIGPDGAYEHTEEFDGADGVCEHTEEFETWDEEYRKMVWNWLKENLESPKTK